MATNQQISAAIDAGDLAEFRRCAQETPALLNETYQSCGNIQEPILFLAVEKGQLEIVRELVQVHNKDPNETGEAGGTSLHAVKYCAQTSDPTTNIDPEDVIEWLLANGADIAATDDRGQTAVHAAIFAGRSPCLDKLIADPNFDAANIPDAAGWSPMDVAGGSGHLDLEARLVAAGKATAPALVDDTHAGDLNTVDVLCMASKIIPKIKDGEDFAAALLRSQAELRDHFNELYARPDFRSVLDIAAGAALGSRTDDPPATRVYIDFGSDGAGSISGKGGFGAFDPAAKTLCLGGARGTKALEGTIVHELTHHAADVIYGNNAVPFVDETSPEALAYIDAIAEDVKGRTSLLGGPDVEVADTVMDRMRAYAARLPDADRNRAAVLQEFIVGIPQAMHEFGENRTAEVSPNLMSIYKNQFETACRQAITADTGLFSQKVTQNVALCAGLEAPVDPPATGDVWLANGQGRPGSRADMAELVIRHYRAQQDTISEADGLRGTDPNARLIGHGNGCFQIPEDPNISGDPESFNDFQRKVRIAVEPPMPELPAEVSMTRIAGFLTTAGAACTDGIDAHTGDMQHAMRDMIREAKFEYVVHRKEAGDSDGVLAALAAEAIFFDAVCEKLENAGGDQGAVPVIDPRQKADMLSKIEKQISKSGNKGNRAALFDSPANMKVLSGMLTNAPNVLDVSAVNAQTDKTLTVNVKSARKLWRAQMKTF